MTACHFFKKLQIALLEATLTKESLQRIADGDWSSFDTLKNPHREYYNKIGIHEKNMSGAINNCILFFQDPFEHLSDEMVLHIFHWLPKSHLPNVALVCKRFHQLCQDKSLWTRMDVSGRSLEPGALGQILSRQIILLRLAQSEVKQKAFVFFSK